jgi:hypothetical protein
MPIPVPVTPTSTTEPGVTRIWFERGQFSARLTGHLGEQGADRYILGARAGQTMEVSATAPQQVGFSIWGADGTVLKRSVDEATEWAGVLPASQDYYLSVVSIAETDYVLTVTVHPRPSEPARIVFEPDKTAATIEGSLDAPEADRYLLRAMAGQGLFVSLASWNQEAVVGIETDDGQVLARAEVGIPFAAVASLPETGDYALIVTSAGGSTVYTLRVAVPPPDEGPTSLFFDPGATSANVEGTLREGGDVARYLLRASQGQELELALRTNGWPVGIWVEGADGTTWKVPFGEHALTAPLPATQDYLVALLTPPHAPETPYALTIRIPAP